ncbi:hypothetical protein ACFX11_041128 [Malus domestica]
MVGTHGFGWIGGSQPSFLVAPSHSALGMLLLILGSICQTTRTWDLEFLRPFITNGEMNTILDTHIGDPFHRDCLIWTIDRRGIFSVRSSYNWIHSKNVTFNERRHLPLVPFMVGFEIVSGKFQALPNIRHFFCGGRSRRH